MNHDEIIAMAIEAGLLPDTSHPTTETRHMRKKAESVHRFAALVAAKEREACAQVCEATYEGAFEGVRPCFDTPDECAVAIRARGNAS